MSEKAPSQRFKDKVAIVTGGCDGVGRGCVDVLAENGGIVVVFDINDEMGSTLGSNGDMVIVYIHCDVTKEYEIQKSIEETVNRFGRIDCLVNNVGMLCTSTHKKITGVHCEHIEYQCISINKKLFDIRRYKGGVSALTRALAIDEAKYGVRVNSIAPGPVDTRLLRSVTSAEEKEKLAQCNHLNRLAETREVGVACLFLAADATFSTGEEIMLTGGAEIGSGVKGGPNGLI